MIAESEQQPSPSSSTNRRNLITSRSRANEVLKAVEPLRDNLNKFSLLLNETKERRPELFQQAKQTSSSSDDIEQNLQKSLKAILYKLDPLVESVCALVEDPSPVESTSDPWGTTQRLEQPDGAPSPRSKPAEQPASSIPPTTKSGSIAPGSAPVQTAAAVPVPKPKAKAKAAAKKPPPGMLRRVPPEKNKSQNQQTTISKTFQPDLTKIDTDLMPERIPDGKLIPKPILWLGVVKSKIPGSVWDNLLAEDKSRVLAKEFVQTLPGIDGQQRESQASSSVNSVVAGEDQGLLRVSEDFPADTSLNGRFRFDVNFSLLDQLFFENEEEKLKSGDKKASLADAAATAAKTRVRTVLEPKKTQLIEISIKGLGLDDNVEAIKRALDDLIFEDDQSNASCNSCNVESLDDMLLVSTGGISGLAGKRRPWGLTIDRLERLLASYPTREEANSLRVLKETCEAEKKVTGDVQKIASADRFLLTLLEIKHFRERASACLTRLTFDREVNSIGEKLSKFVRVVEECTIAVDEIRPLLALIVKMGNYINCKTRKSVVSGIQLSSLGSLKQVRSVDGGTTFLKVIAEHIEEQFISPQIITVQVEKIASCLEIADINPTDLELQLGRLQTRINDVDHELQTPDVNDKFKTFFTSFVEKAKTMLHGLIERVTEAKTKLSNLMIKTAVTIDTKNAKWFDDASVALKQLGIFGRELLLAHREVIQEKKSIEKKRQRERDRNNNNINNSSASRNGLPNGLRSIKKNSNITPILSTLHSDQSEETDADRPSFDPSQEDPRPIGPGKKNRQLLTSRKSMPPGCFGDHHHHSNNNNGPIATTRDSTQATPAPLTTVKSVIAKKNPIITKSKVGSRRSDSMVETKTDNASVVSSVIGRTYSTNPQMTMMMMSHFDYPISPKSTSRTTKVLKEKSASTGSGGGGRHGTPLMSEVSGGRRYRQESFYSASAGDPTNYPLHPSGLIEQVGAPSRPMESAVGNYHQPVLQQTQSQQRIVDEHSSQENFQLARRLTMERERQAFDSAAAALRERSIRTSVDYRHVVQSSPSDRRPIVGARNILTSHHRQLDRVLVDNQHQHQHQQQQQHQYHHHHQSPEFAFSSTAPPAALLRDGRTVSAEGGGIMYESDTAGFSYYDPASSSNGGRIQTERGLCDINYNLTDQQVGGSGVVYMDTSGENLGGGQQRSLTGHPPVRGYYSALRPSLGRGGWMRASP